MHERSTRLIAEQENLQETPPSLGSSLQEEMVTKYIANNIKVASSQDVACLSPPNLAAAEGVQLDDEIMVLVGGYINTFR